MYCVLLIEDDLLTIELARRAALECCPEICPEINLTVTGGGDAVLDWLRDGEARSKHMPHLILLDLKMPKLDGLAVLRKLRMHADTCDIPIVAFSAEYTQADVVMSYQVGVNSFVPMPTDLEQFKEFFRERLAYWMQLHIA